MCVAMYLVPVCMSVAVQVYMWKYARSKLTDKALLVDLDVMHAVVLCDTIIVLISISTIIVE